MQRYCKKLIYATNLLSGNTYTVFRGRWRYGNQHVKITESSLR